MTPHAHPQPSQPSPLVARALARAEVDRRIARMLAGDVKARPFRFPRAADPQYEGRLLEAYGGVMDEADREWFPLLARVGRG